MTDDLESVSSGERDRHREAAASRQACYVHARVTTLLGAFGARSRFWVDSVATGQMEETGVTEGTSSRREHNKADGSTVTDTERRKHSR